jgi:hypothetical protein
MDQLASVGVEFDELTISRICQRLERYYRNDPNSSAVTELTALNPQGGKSGPAQRVKGKRRYCGVLPPASPPQWAMQPIYDNNTPVRPWGLGALLSAGGFLFTLMGLNMRSPGMYKKVNPWTGMETNTFLEDSNERIHSSVRIRLAAQGLGLDDKEVWDAPALKGWWRLRKTTKDYLDPIPKSVQTWTPGALHAPAGPAEQRPLTERAAAAARRNTVAHTAAVLQRRMSSDLGKLDRWVWEYCGPEKNAPAQRLLVEAPLGPFERELVRLSGGYPNVYEFADEVDVVI